MRAGLLVVALLGFAVGAAAWYRSGQGARSSPAGPLPGVVPVAVPPENPRPVATPVAVPAAKPALSAELRQDPLIDRWYRSIQRRDPRGVLEAQASLQHREAESRDVLERIAREEPDARVRAFSVTALSRFKAPPPGAFFTGCLEDADHGPRLAALAALEKLGIRDSLSRVEQLASGDPHEEVRAAALKTAAALRAK